MFKTILTRMGILPRAEETTPEALAALETAPARDHGELTLDPAADHFAEDEELDPSWQPLDPYVDDYDGYDSEVDDDIPVAAPAQSLPDDRDFTSLEDEIYSDLVDAEDAREDAENRDPGEAGNAHTRPKSLDEAKRRYAFIGSILKKNNITSQEVIDEATMGYADYRRRNRLAYYTEGQVEGWRFASLEQGDWRATFRGVRDDGLVFARTFHRHDQFDPFDEGAGAPVDWSYSDPLKTTQQLADATVADKSPVNSRRSIEAPLTPFIIQSKDFRKLVDGKRQQVFDIVEQGIDTASERSLRATPPDAVDKRKALLKISYTMRQDEIRRFGAMTNALMRSLDPETQKTMRSTGEYGRFMANWLTGGKQTEEGFKADPEIGRNRVQAIRSYQVFGDFITDSTQIMNQIDSGKPLAPMLAQKLDMKPQSLARLQGVTWQKAGRHHYHKPKRLAMLVNLVDPNHVPTSRAGFASLEVATEAACVLATNCDKLGPQEALAGVGGRFEKVAELAEGNPPAGMNDMARNIRNQLAVPAMTQAAMAHGIDRAEALRIAEKESEEFGPLEGLSVRNAMQNSARWHRNETVIRQALNDPDFLQERPWEPLVGELDLGGGLRAVELASPQDLQIEGNNQDHCVGGYSNAVLEGDSQIFSIRHGDEILSTVEFGALHKTRTIEDPETGTSKELRDTRIDQHMAYSNEEPCKTAQNAAATLQAHLNSVPASRWDDYFSSLEDTMHQQNDRKEELTRIERRCGFDPASREKLEASWSMLSQYLPKGDRKKGLDAWVQDRIEPRIKPSQTEHNRNTARSLLQQLQAD